MFYGLTLTWSLSIGVMAFLLALCLFYILGLWGVYQRHARNPEASIVSIWRVLAFFAGVVSACLILLSPINTIGRTQLFSVHMAQVVFLNTISAPLILAGCTEAVLEPLQKIGGLRSLLKLALSPVVASVLFNLSFLLWHTPRIYNWAMASSSTYSCMMLWLFIISLFNWWPLIGSISEWRRMSYPAQMLYALFDGFPVDIFAFVLVYSGFALYSHYVIPQALNLSAFNDQAVAGALLLLPGLVDLIVMSPLFFRWLRDLEEKTRLADQRRALEAEEYDEDVGWEESTEV